MINVVIYTDGDPFDIDPEHIEDVLTEDGHDVFLVDIRHVNNVTDHFGAPVAE